MSWLNPGAGFSWVLGWNYPFQAVNWPANGYW
jgi:hypothetical protein